MRNTANVTGGKPIAVWSQSISDVSAVNSLVAFYHMHGRAKGRGAILLFCPGHHTRLVYTYSLLYLLKHSIDNNYTINGNGGLISKRDFF
jgi:hypothetical protein